jgi:ABC-2 type transport system permease protein
VADMPTSSRKLAGTWSTPYRAVLRSRIRAQRAYPLSFATDVFSALLVGLVEFGEVWVIFHNVKALGGLDLKAMLLLYGLSNATFASADMFVGHIDTLPIYIQQGTLDAFYLRPQPLLMQLMTSELALRRVARIAVAAAVLGVGLTIDHIVWSPAKVALLVLCVVTGVLLFAGIFVCAAGLQFFLVNGAEFAASIIYGASYASQQPTPIFPRPMMLIFGFTIPIAFTAYLPTIALLDRPGPALLPAWLAWWTPLAVLWVWVLGLWLWRCGTRHYQGGGG